MTRRYFFLRRLTIKYCTLVYVLYDNYFVEFLIHSILLIFMVFVLFIPVLKLS